MMVQVTYCSHRTTDLGVREQLAFSSEEQLQRAYGTLRKDFPSSELVVLSTCNRVELYVAQEDPADTPNERQIAEFFSNFHSLPLEQFSDDLLSQRGPDAVRHLFEVASSVDSMVLGEPQIVNQVKEAYRVAQQNDACGPLTHALFQAAIRVSGRVRTETRLADGRVSIASVAVGDFGRSIFDQFDDKQVLIIGAGEMAEETLRYLRNEGEPTIIVVNRHPERAEDLASKCGGTAKPFEELDHWIACADIIVSTTGADRPIVDVDRFVQIRQNSDSHPLFILDLGAPRDFDPQVGDVDENVFLYDIDDLEATCESNRTARTAELERAEGIIEQETDRFMHDVFHRATGPIIRRLREEWHDVRHEEVERLFTKLPHLDEPHRKEIEKSIERIINKLLHPPLEALRDEARGGAPHTLIEALKRLFHLRD